MQGKERVKEGEEGSEGSLIQSPGFIITAGHRTKSGQN